MSDWDAASYHRVSDPQRAWGMRVLDRLSPRPGERILDIGCGTGRLTASIAARTANGRVLAIDRSWNMLVEAARHATQVPVAQADAVALPFGSSFDAVFSTATFHWVPDHDALFAEIHRVLVPGGRLVAQSGGGPNLARLYARAASLAAAQEYAPYFDRWQDPWTFAGADDTRERLERAGFSRSDAWLESTPTTFPNADAFTEFVTTVCLRHHVERLPAHLRSPFVQRIVTSAADDDPAFLLDYWRLNIDARK